MWVDCEATDKPAAFLSACVNWPLSMGSCILRSCGVALQCWKQMRRYCSAYSVVLGDGAGIEPARYRVPPIVRKPYTGYWNGFLSTPLAISMIDRPSSHQISLPHWYIDGNLIVIPKGAIRRLTSSSSTHSPVIVSFHPNLSPHWYLRLIPTGEGVGDGALCSDASGSRSCFAAAVSIPLPMTVPCAGTG
jgi:hypothetical protein